MGILPYKLLRTKFLLIISQSQQNPQLKLNVKLRWNNIEATLLKATYLELAYG